MQNGERLKWIANRRYIVRGGMCYALQPLMLLKCNEIDACDVSKVWNPVTSKYLQYPAEQEAAFNLLSMESDWTLNTVYHFI